ncbi:hypothetical protein M436DRAFT_60843 [Aureobasidium namibiae CBS 147.97]|uniref:Uncharacterized protein n=1 Tax=Aureobasidium namibiae CBS 147.97 TaxID=1043004 RepID=A0A074WV65_9PEZI|nr:uncharacterized protein M436DRAFT_60843 [Aureobasidium namibiae CBS 147.97]KEQ77063.1 hypothetical protein M436DRAFT_60843 [Aureobasidium namibiae CBS 147.97]
MSTAFVLLQHGYFGVFRYCASRQTLLYSNIQKRALDQPTSLTSSALSGEPGRGTKHQTSKSAMPIRESVDSTLPCQTMQNSNLLCLAQWEKSPGYNSHSFLERPLSGSASIGLIAVPLVDVVRACIAIAKYDTLTLIIFGQPARHFLDMHFAYNSKPPGQIEMACCTPYTAIPRKGHQALCRSVDSRGGYSSSNFYHGGGWNRAAATLKSSRPFGLPVSARHALRLSDAFPPCMRLVWVVRTVKNSRGSSNTAPACQEGVGSAH